MSPLHNGKHNGAQYLYSMAITRIVQGGRSEQSKEDFGDEASQQGRQRRQSPLVNQAICPITALCHERLSHRHTQTLQDELARH